MKNICIDCNVSMILLKEYYTCTECGSVSNNKIMENEAVENNLIENNTIENKGTYVPKGSKSYIVKDNKYIYNDIYKFNIQLLYTKEMRAEDNINDYIDSICLNNFHDLIKKSTKQLWIFIKNTHKAQIRKEIIGACLYYACIENNRPIEIEEITKLINLETMNKGLKIFRENICNTEKKYLLSKKIDLKICIDYYTQKIENIIPIDNTSYIHSIENIDSSILNSSNKIISYAIIYCGIKNKITLKKFSEITKITYTTLNNIIKTYLSNI